MSCVLSVTTADPSFIDPAEQNRQRGRVLVLLSGVVMSLGAPIVRLLESATPWQFLAYRSVALCVIVLAMLLLIHKRSLPAVLRRAGVRAVLAGFFLAVTFICIVFSILTTTIANALFLLGTAPFLTALLAWFVLGERPTRRTWFAIAGAITGMLIMLGEGMAEGDLFGDLTAIAAAATFACYSVVVRGGRDNEMVPAVLWAGLISGVVAFSMAAISNGGLQVSSWDIGVSFAYGVVGVGGGMVLYTLGSKFVPAAELNLLSLGEIVLAPIWVWLGFNEVPSTPTLLGGLILMAAILMQATESSQHMSKKAQTRTKDYFPIVVMLAGAGMLGLAVSRWLLG